MKPTSEQEAIIHHTTSGSSLKVIANAGCAKTSTLVMVSESNNQPTLYLTFNKNMADEAKLKFPSWVEVRTTHSLAYGSVGSKYKHKLKRPYGGYKNVCGTASEVASYFKIAPIKAKKSGEDERWITSSAIGSAILNTLARWEHSDSTVIGDSHISYIGMDKFRKDRTLEETFKDVGVQCVNKYKDVVLSLSAKLWNLRVDKKSNTLITHDTYLKLFQLSKPDLSKYKIVMLDEAHDSNDCVVDIVKSCDAQKIVVGDPNQQIYAWRGSVNALDKFDFPTLRLSTSFRYGQSVADVASAITGVQDMFGWEGCSTTVVGEFDSVPVKGSVFVYRTNSAMLQEAVEQITHGWKVNISTDVRDFVNLAYSTIALKNGDKNKVKHQSLLEYDSWDELVEAKDWVATDLQRVIGMVGSGKIYEVLSALKDHKNTDNPDITFVTAHRSKGLEYDVVVLGDDYPCPSKDSRQEEMNILYVAVTRAKKILKVNSSVSWYLRSGCSLPSLQDTKLYNVTTESLPLIEKILDDRIVNSVLVHSRDLQDEITAYEDNLPLELIK